MDLFQIKGTTLTPLPRVTLKLEKEIQRLLEGNLEAVFGIRFLASEYPTGEKHGGRIDTLGLDENHTPVILEYKATSSVNIITQALFYLDWLTDHKGDFEILVRRRLGEAVTVDWTEPRVLCVAETFSRYDLSAIAHLGRSVQLAEFKLFHEGLLSVHLAGKAEARKTGPPQAVDPPPIPPYSVEQHLGRARGATRGIAEDLRQCMLELGDDVSEGPTREYIAFRTTRNFCCLEVHQEHILLHLRLDPKVGEGCAICSDVTNVGHFGTGNMRVRVSGSDDVPIAKAFIERAYRQLSQ